MARTLVESILLGLLVISFGCSEGQLRRGYDRVAGSNRDGRVDINSASQRELQRLPGLSQDDADRIVANRPYPDTEVLLRRGVIGPRQFDQIEDYVYAGGGRRRNPDRDNNPRRYYDTDDHQ